jgi:hypothetical protein
MHRIDTIPAFDFANERRGDVFTLEFPNRWDARAARRAAELDPIHLDRPSIGRRALARGLAAVSGGSRHGATSR